MLTFVAALALSLDVNASVYRPAAAPVKTCNIRTVSYRFVGEPGTKFRYDGDVYSVPANGSIELIASRQKDYEVAGRKQALDVWPSDEFGTRTITLPTARATQQ